MRNLYFQFWVLVVLNMIDVWFTYLMLQLGGIEINPLIVISMDNFGILEGLLAVKIPILLILGWVIYMHRNYQWDENENWLRYNFPKALDVCICIYLGIDIYTFILLHI